jgi:hypothetical protein
MRSYLDATRIDLGYRWYTSNACCSRSELMMNLHVVLVLV